MRLFIATDLPLAIQDWAIHQRDTLKRCLPPDYRLRWTDPEGWHVTLQFLGEQPESRGVQILDSMKRASEGIPPFTMALGAPGTFSGPRMGVLWLSVTTGVNSLVTMADRLDPSRPLRAHVTLARSNQKIPADIIKGLTITDPCPEALIDRIHLYESVLRAKGSTYTRIHTVPLY